MAGPIADEVASTAWYHTIELPGGIATPGFVDLRGVRPRVPIPRLDGLRCLDVGSATGFWAFELEKMGAAEVVSFDLEDKRDEDWAAGRGQVDGPIGIARRGFEIARAHLGSSVQRAGGSVYDLDPDEHGTFDFVFVGSLLLHLRDPVGALMAVRGVTRGALLSFDVVSPLLSLLFRRQAVYGWFWPEIQQWFIPNRHGHRRMVEEAGFRVVRQSGLLHQQLGAGFPRTRVRDLRSPRQLRNVAYTQPVGVPAGWVLAEAT